MHIRIRPQPWSGSQSGEPVKVGWAKSKLSDDRFVKFCGIGVMSVDDVARSFSHVPRAQMQAQLVAAPEQLFGAAQVPCIAQRTQRPKIDLNM